MGRLQGCAEGDTGRRGYGRRARLLQWDIQREWPLSTGTICALVQLPRGASGEVSAVHGYGAIPASGKSVERIYCCIRPSNKALQRRPRSQSLISIEVSHAAPLN